jgi:hypothetical protein
MQYCQQMSLIDGRLLQIEPNFSGTGGTKFGIGRVCSLPWLLCDRGLVCIHHRSHLCAFAIRLHEPELYLSESVALCNLQLAPILPYNGQSLKFLESNSA